LYQSLQAANKLVVLIPNLQSCSSIPFFFSVQMPFFGPAPASPPRTHRKRSRIQSPQKLHQVLNYSSSVDKVSNLLGLDVPNIYEIFKEQAEGEIQKRKLINRPRNKRNSRKALAWLGHDPSTEKVKNTLGIDEEAVNNVNMQNVLHRNRPRRVEASIHKKKYAKALSTLGFDVSLYKAAQLLGVEDEGILRTLIRHHAERALQQEERRRCRKLGQERVALHNKRRNKKALHVIGYDPSLEKALEMLGVEEGTQEEVQLGSILPVSKRQREEVSMFPQTTALVYVLSAAILLSSLRQSL
jgi:hypothetical protein